MSSAVSSTSRAPDALQRHETLHSSKRKSERGEALVEGEIAEAASGKTLPARLYIRGAAPKGLIDDCWQALRIYEQIAETAR